MEIPGTEGLALSFSDESDPERRAGRWDSWQKLGLQFLELPSTMSSNEPASARTSKLAAFCTLNLPELCLESGHFARPAEPAQLCQMRSRKPTPYALSEDSSLPSSLILSLIHLPPCHYSLLDPSSHLAASDLQLLASRPYPETRQVCLSQLSIVSSPSPSRPAKCS